MKKIFSLLFLILFSAKIYSQDIKVGALLSLTGEWSSLGINSKTALEIAKADIEKYLMSINSKVKIDLKIEDTKLDPQTALDKLKELNLAGYKIVIGPQSSAEILGIKKYADENNILVISQSSTASNLSMPDDNIFRLCPDDLGEAKAITSLIVDDNIKYIIPVYRLDIGNEGLYKSVYDVASDEKLLVSEPVTYTDDSESYENIIKNVKSKLEDALTKFPNSQIGIYLAAFDENLEIFREASKFPELGKVKWYGSDGAALSKILISNSVASDFAMRVDYPCPIFGLENNASEKWMPVKKAIFESTRIEPDAFALAAYDALWLVYLAQISNGNSKDINVIKNSFSGMASNYYGLTGWTHLNSAGDRQFGNFDYWIVRKNNDGNYEWVKVDSFDGMSGTIIGN